MAQQEFIASDWCGWNDQYGRYTHIPSGETLVCRPGWGQERWDREQLEFLRRFPGVNVHSCPGAYTTDGRLVGSADELCDLLRQKLAPEAKGP